MIEAWQLEIREEELVRGWLAQAKASQSEARTLSTGGYRGTRRHENVVSEMRTIVSASSDA